MIIQIQKRETVKEEIKNRLQSNCPIPSLLVPKSTPVISFGDFERARVFTLGINPSNLEFEDRKGQLLKNNLRRLQTQSSLRAEYGVPYSDRQLERILEGCFNYFNKRPYYWFNKLENILLTLGYTYYEVGSAAHVDLVQWATKGKWRFLSNSEKQELIDGGRQFLEYQLRSTNLELLLLNGRKVCEEFQEWSGIQFSYSPFEIPKGKNAHIMTGLYNGRVKVIGWSANLQSSYGISTEDIDRLANKVKAIIAGL